jgi:nicotinamide/nicotinate riboside kinase
VLGQQDWDDPDGAIDWTRFRAQLQDLRATGRLPSDHVTYDYLVQPDPIAVDEGM